MSVLAPNPGILQYGREGKVLSGISPRNLQQLDYVDLTTILDVDPHYDGPTHFQVYARVDGKQYPHASPPPGPAELNYTRRSLITGAPITLSTHYPPGNEDALFSGVERVARTYPYPHDGSGPQYEKDIREYQQAALGEISRLLTRAQQLSLEHRQWGTDIITTPYNGGKVVGHIAQTELLYPDGQIFPFQAKRIMTSEGMLIAAGGFNVPEILVAEAGAPVNIIDIDDCVAVGATKYLVGLLCLVMNTNVQHWHWGGVYAAVDSLKEAAENSKVPVDIDVGKQVPFLGPNGYMYEYDENGNLVMVAGDMGKFLSMFDPDFARWGQQFRAHQDYLPSAVAGARNHVGTHH